MAKTVLYIHGLESGPQGRKARQLAEAGFTVVSHLMPCGRAQIARDPFVMIGSVLAAGVMVAGGVIGGAFGFVAAAALTGASTAFVRPLLARRVVQRSVDVQRRALKAQPIDVVVGSSFGGAIALGLVSSGVWAGPTVLLCPAHQLVARRARLPPPPPLATLPADLQSHIVVVHGAHDETVPLAHSQALVDGSSARLVLVDDGHRLSATATPDRFTEWIALAEKVV